MSISLFSLPKPLRSRVQQELQPGETVVWASRPNWRTQWRQVLGMLLFGSIWTAITGFFLVMIASAALGIAPIKMSGKPPERGWALFFLVFLVPFVLIGFAVMHAAVREIRSNKRRVHVITDRRVLTLELGRVKPVEDKPREAINFVRNTETSDSSGTLVIALAAVKVGDDNGRPETLTWPGVGNVAYAQAELDSRTSSTSTADRRTPEPTVVPSELADLPMPLARAAARETRGERIAWVGRPAAWTAAKWSALVWIFAVPWLYFTVRWEMFGLGMLFNESARVASKTPLFVSVIIALWGLPFVAVGLSMFATPWWVHRMAGATVYLVTDRRILTVRRRRGEIHVASVEPGRIVSVEPTGMPGSRSSIKIALGKTIDSDGDETVLAETLWLVEDAERAVELIEELRRASDKRAA